MLYGWSCWLEGFAKARAKRRGNGPQRLRHALKTAAGYRFLVEGQFRTPRRIPRYLRPSRLLRKRANE